MKKLRDYIRKTRNVGGGVANHFAQKCNLVLNYGYLVDGADQEYPLTSIMLWTRLSNINQRFMGMDVALFEIKKVASRVLEPVSFSIEAGACLGLAGPCLYLRPFLGHSIH